MNYQKYTRFPDVPIVNRKWPNKKIEKNEKFSSHVSLTDVDVSKLVPGPYLLKIGSGQNAITSRFIIGK